jgi:hypothetical protein
MKPISTRTHGVLDLVVPLALMFAPKLFGFSDNKTARQLPRMMAAGMRAGRGHRPRQQRLPEGEAGTLLRPGWCAWKGHAW